jgi:Fe-S oxidoreductase
VPPQTCCGRPLYDFGLLESAREHLDDVCATLAGTPADAPIVLLEPSCFAVFSDEAQHLASNRREARALADRAVLFDSVVGGHFERGGLPLVGRDALVHVHCHQQAIVGSEPTARALAAAHVRGNILDAGCCGMAGGFGYERTHYRVSVDVGERVLLPAVRATPPDTAIIADGFSCREQIHQLTGRRAHHLAEVVSGAIERQKTVERATHAGAVP